MTEPNPLSRLVPSVREADAPRDERSLAGIPAKSWRMALTFDRPDIANGPGSTRLVRQEMQPPLQIQRTFRQRGPADLQVVLLNPTGGLVQGDALTISLALGPGAGVHWTTPAATKAYRCPLAPITQQIQITLSDGALLVSTPHELIPFAEAQFFQQVRANLVPTARLFLAETIAPGRLARNECHHYRSVDMSTRITTDHATSPGTGRLLYRDRLLLTPTSWWPKPPLNSWYHSSITFVSPAESPPTLREMERQVGEILAGAERIGWDDKQPVPCCSRADQLWYGGSSLLATNGLTVRFLSKYAATAQELTRKIAICCGVLAY